ncbi:MAG: 50S ribosomal protein L10 [Elusimicrobia bacterium]|nr:50S ribosomal protein L10 [Elusimicrobiota bacterium]
MPKAEKEAAVQTLVEKLKQATSVFITDYQGLKMAELDELRAKLRPLQGEYHVVKNSLTRRAFGAVGWDTCVPQVEGPTALVIDRSDPIAAAKIGIEFAKEHERLKLRAGWVEGRLLTSGEVKTLAALPSRPVLLSRCVQMMASPLYRFATALETPLRQLVLVLQQIAQQTGKVEG